MKWFLTADVHGDVWELKHRIDNAKVPDGSNIIILGELSINYWLDKSDARKKKFLSKLPYTFFALNGNHEARPEEVEGYHEALYKEEDTVLHVFVQDKYPNIFFLKNGEHLLNGNRILVLGGAYSVDKDYRLATGKKWWASEQLTEEERKYFLATVSGHYDFVFTHTCPYLARPLEKGLSFVDQSKVDSTMEIFLENIRGQITYGQFYCGHWHIDETRDDEVGRIHFLFKDMKGIDV